MPDEIDGSLYDDEPLPTVARKGAEESNALQKQGESKKKSLLGDSRLLQSVSKLRGEAELSLDTLETVTEEIWENQRWAPNGWGVPMGFERSAWSDKTGLHVRRKESFYAPFLWEWTGAWEVAPFKENKEGWHYATDFTASTAHCSCKSGLLFLVRRRRWKRIRTRVTASFLKRRIAEGYTGKKYWCEREMYGFPPPTPPPPSLISWEEHDKGHISAAAWDTYFISLAKGTLKIDGIPCDVKGKPRELIRKHGVPPGLRQAVWMAASGAKKKKSENDGYFACVVENIKPDSPWQHEVRKDLGRTLPDHPYFSFENSPGRDKLLRILLAVSYRNPLVNYCQSFNNIAAGLLTNVGEEDSFWLMITLLESILPNDYYDSHLTGITVDIRVMDDLLKHQCKTLHSHFKRYNIDLSPFAAGWLLNLYVSVFPIDTTFRIWDLLFSEGSKTIFRVFLGILKVQEAVLLKATSLGEVLEVVTGYCKTLHDPKELFKEVFSCSFGKTKIASLRAKHRVDVCKELDMTKVLEGMSINGDPDDVGELCSNNNSDSDKDSWVPRKNSNPTRDEDVLIA